MLNVAPHLKQNLWVLTKLSFLLLCILKVLAVSFRLLFELLVDIYRS
jgi:hypothetical protein